MFKKTPRGRLIHIAYPVVEWGDEDGAFCDLGMFREWSHFASCGQGWNMQTVDGPPTCSKCINDMDELIDDLIKVQTNVGTTLSFLRSHFAESEPFNTGVDGE